MKKLLAFVSALVLAASAAISVCAAAQDTVIVPDADGEPTPDTAGTAIEYRSTDYSYEITIPAKVTLSSTDTVSADITASNVKIKRNDIIIVTIADDQQFTISNGSATINYTVSRAGVNGFLSAGSLAAAFDSDTGDSGTQTLVFGQVNENDVDYAGTYSGTLTFDISIEGLS